MTPAYIALGSNLQDPLAQLQLAVAALRALPDTQFQRGSSIYRSAAVGPGTQPDYLNAVALITTTLSPIALLDALQQIEHAQGRVRSEHWGPRTLDLDILLYGDQTIDSARLTVPHPAMRQRNFVLYPLAEINNTNLELPDGTDLDTLVRTCPREDLGKTNLQLDNNLRERE
jgi:2-amino-4-hydroxy-6-hydroxymethyldihydropteridine diphosphokinase